MAEQFPNLSFMAPLWWIRAYEVALQMRALEVDPFTISQSTGLFPALLDAELNALLVILQSAQNQILHGQKWVGFSEDHLRKNNASVGQTKKFLFLRVLQGLRSIQLSSSLSVSEGGGAYDPIPLFEREERRRDAQGTLRTMYRPSGIAIEMILGFGEAYSEFVRLLDGKPRVHRFLGHAPPMSLRPSVWLDLNSIEQYIYIQIQKASVWEKNIYRWDSLFGKGLDSLFQGIKLKKRFSEEHEWSRYKTKIYILKKVGRKLMEQGILSMPTDVDYLAIEQDGEPLSIVWQLHDQDAKERELRSYEMKCGQYFREHVLDAALKRVSLVISHSSGLKHENSMQLWKELDDADKEVNVGHVRMEGNLLLSIAGLFFEWSMRKNANDVLRLPGWLNDSPAAKLLDSNSNRPLIERLQMFSQHIIDQSEYQKDLVALPRATLASPSSLRQRELLEFLASHSAKSSSSREAVVNPSDAMNGMSNAPKVAHNQSLLAPVSPPRKPQNDSELRRQAAEVLQKLREREPKKYQSLKQRYLENLETERKQIILEMKERMQPQAFDDHLRYSLVKYMIENPLVWDQEETRL